MIGVVATLKVQPAKAAEFEKVFLDLAAKVKANEPGCLMYQLTRSKSEEGVYKVLELYASTDALKHHGGSPKDQLTTENLDALEKGLPNLLQHVDNIQTVFGLPCVVAINAFPTDTPAELAQVEE